MKVLVYGAGVIGCYLTHVLCRAGNDVTLLARGPWKQTLETKGLSIRHHLQRKTTLDHPRITGRIDPTEHYDAVFSMMSYHQVGQILDDLAAVDAEAVILVGNNLSAGEMEAHIQAHTKAKKQVLFAFQTTAGKREGDHAVCERMGDGTMDIGFLASPVPEELQKTLGALFRNTGYRLRWHENMESFFCCHVAAILPLGYLAYGAGCDFKQTTRAQRRRSMEASAEAYALLRELGYAIVPEGDDAFYRPGPKGLVMMLLLFLMSHSVIGELVAAAHCRHAVAEMEALDRAWDALRSARPAFPMPHWEALHRAMPDWDTLHRLYDPDGGTGP